MTVGEQYSFYRVPKVLFTAECFKFLSCEAKGDCVGKPCGFTGADPVRRTCSTKEKRLSFIPGNSLGGFDSYIKLIDEFEMYQGGFIWDFIDQAILVKDHVTGKEVLRYGGDFDDRPSDYEFSGNGIVFADRKEKPAMQEVRYYYGLYR